MSRQSINAYIPYQVIPTSTLLVFLFSCEAASATVDAPLDSSSATIIRVTPLRVTPSLNLYQIGYFRRYPFLATPLPYLCYLTNVSITVSLAF
jgi:hypothetical protein